MSTRLKTAEKSFIDEVRKAFSDYVNVRGDVLTTSSENRAFADALYDCAMVYMLFKLLADRRPEHKELIDWLEKAGGASDSNIATLSKNQALRDTASIHLTRAVEVYLKTHDNKMPYSELEPIVHNAADAVIKTMDELRKENYAFTTDGKLKEQRPATPDALGNLPEGRVASAIFAGTLAFLASISAWCCSRGDMHNPLKPQSRTHTTNKNGLLEKARADQQQRNNRNDIGL